MRINSAFLCQHIINIETPHAVELFLNDEAWFGHRIGSRHWLLTNGKEAHFMNPDSSFCSCGADGACEFIDALNSVLSRVRY